MNTPPLTIGELTDHLMDLEQQTGEIEAEHLGETARFGDSWPGAALQIQNMREGVRDLRAEIEAREDAFVGPIPMTWFEAERFAADQAIMNFVGPELPVPF